MTTLAVNAQEKKGFTLEDVVPGGNNYFNLTPQNIPGLQWWGDTFVKADVESIVAVKNGKEETLVTLEEVNDALARVPMPIGAPVQSQVELKPVRTLMNASLPYGDRNIVVIRERLYIMEYDFGTKEVTKLINLPEGAANFDFSKESGLTAYTAGDDLYVGNTVVATGEGRDILVGQSVHRDEFGIFKGTFWSPKGQKLAFYRMDQSMVTDYPQVNTSLRTATLEPDKYPMAGMTSHKVTVGVYDVNTGSVVYLQAGDPTDRYFTNISWAPDEKSIYIIELNRDQNHAQLVRYSAETGEKEATIYEEKHPKYVEPENPLTFLPWDETKFILQSQRDGYNHLYLFDLSTEQEGEWTEISGTGASYIEHCKVTQLTSGEWVVKQLVGLNKSKKNIIISSTEVSPLQANIYSVDIVTKKRTLIGESEGTHRAVLSESGKQLIDSYSSFSTPRVISILPTDRAGTRPAPTDRAGTRPAPTDRAGTRPAPTDGKKGEVYFTATDPLREEYEVPEITLGTIKAADGVTDLYYRMVKPTGFDETKKYPAIIYVYGGPHAQLIADGRFYGAGGWDLYMAQKGYVMLTVDGRGSSFRGLNFENCTFRHLGVEEMKDQMEGVALLKSLPYVDASRIGVYGWSFGGFMTTNLMLTYNDTFKAAVAGGPVIDWKFYEVMYGERYMDTPETNPEGYKGSDLKQKAGNLKGRLMIIIGGQDPVCVPQHTFSFLRACIDAGTHPDFFVYPEDVHNMRGRDRVHLMEHITRYFDDNL